MTLRNFLAGLAVGLAVPVFSLAGQGANDGALTYENKPSGSETAPLVLRTYFPNPGLDTQVTARHGAGAETPKYSAKTGLLSESGRDKPISGIPAAIGVSAGTGLSYVWDTTECRLLYAWANGFVDMQPYWGTKGQGSRKSNDYVPRLIGQLFYKAKGGHPLRINGKPVSETSRYTGHRRIKGHPVFTFENDGRQISVAVAKGEADQTLVVSYSSSNAGDRLGYEDPGTPFEIVSESKGKLSVLIRPNAAETHTGYKSESVVITEASAEAGAKLYEGFGCVACHTIDGSLNHGPSFHGLAGKEREFPGIGKVVADENYLRESIKNPAAKSVPEFPVGMMPPYPLTDPQIDSLILFIQSLKD